MTDGTGSRSCTLCGKGSQRKAERQQQGEAEGCMTAFEKLHYNNTPFLYTDCLTGFYYKSIHLLRNNVNKVTAFLRKKVPFSCTKDWISDKIGQGKYDIEEKGIETE